MGNLQDVLAGRKSKHRPHWCRYNRHFFMSGSRHRFFYMVEVPLAVPYAGAVLSGLLISRGANFVHDLLKLIQDVSK
jgi:hypothetical protein